MDAFPRFVPQVRPAPFAVVFAAAAVAAIAATVVVATGGCSQSSPEPQRLERATPADLPSASGTPYVSPAQLPAGPIAGAAPSALAATLGARVSAEEYRFRRRGAGFEAVNRANGLRARFSEEGVVIHPRTRRGWEIRLHPAQLGRAGGPPRAPVRSAPRLGACDPTARPGALPGCLRQLEYQRPDVTEFYRNGERGLEHGLEVARAPVGDGPLLVEVATEGARLRLEGDAIVLSAGANDLLRYDRLYIEDAGGAPVAGRLEVRGSRIVIMVEDAGAQYPLTIDPLLSVPTVVLDPDQQGAGFGGGLAGVGDVDRDGFDDVVVGAPRFDTNLPDAGRVFLFRGSALGVESVASWTADGVQESELFGGAVAGAGDVDADGFADVLVGARGYSYGQLEEGRAVLFLGSAQGLQSAPVWEGQSDQSGSGFGGAVAGAGDVNGDGFADILVGARGFSLTESAEGRVFLYLGADGGPATAPSWTASGTAAAANLGAAVAGIGDIDDDGYDDVVVGASGRFDARGCAVAYYGSAGGLPEASSWEYCLPGLSNNDLAHFGSAVVSAGDVDGDGFPDLLVGAEQQSGAGGTSSLGAAYLFPGGAAGLPAAPTWFVYGAGRDADMGRLGSIADAGDVDGDGFDDVVLGEPGYGLYIADVIGGIEGEGRAGLYLGSADGLAREPAWLRVGGQEYAWFGGTVAGVGDVDGDGYDDVAVGATGYDNGTDGEGAVFLFHGTPKLTMVDRALWAREGNTGDGYGTSVAGAGDVDGDGYSDLLVGAPGFDDGVLDGGAAFLFAGGAAGPGFDASWSLTGDEPDARLGAAVAAAGDVDGDGLADVLVGAPGAVGRGRVYLFLGDAQGLAATAAWTAEGAESGADLGAALAGAGDVNDDGRADVVIGEPGYSGDISRQGRALVFLGTGDGLSTAPVWEEVSGQVEAELGAAVAGVGDVNADGFADIAVGIPGWDGGHLDEGRVQLYLGGSGGPAAGAWWSAEANQESAHLGAALDGAGDVDGDGYADVLVGAPDWDGDTVDCGRAALHMGAALGLSTIPSWAVEGAAAGARLGTALGTLGDLDGDGLSDVGVGAPGGEDFAQAEILVFYGRRSSPPATTADEHFRGDFDGSRFGAALAAAGDVNGDGLSDWTAGAPRHGAAGIDAGRAFVFAGAVRVSLGTADWRRTSGGGTSLAPAADIDGDGYHDLVSGTGTRESYGTVLVQTGSATGLGGGWGWSQPVRQYGGACGQAAAGGDVNGDGYDDVLVGCSGYSNTASFEGRADVYLGGTGAVSDSVWTIYGGAASAGLGRAVAFAGDVNGDGFDDIAVGAPGGNGDGVGAAFVYLGSPAGPQPENVWSAFGRSGAEYGARLAAAGDVDGDGYADLLVAAPAYDDGDSSGGRVYLYRGGADGLAPEPAWTVSGDATGARLGDAIASAGDVDGDGYSDVLVAAPEQPEGLAATDGLASGRVYLYRGGADGLAREPAWVGEGGQEYARYGAGVAGAGDVDGDGRSEILVGAPYYDGQASGVGAVFLYRGSNLPWTWRDGFASADNGGYLGRSVTAGDFDGDGRVDAIAAALLSGEENLYGYDGGARRSAVAALQQRDPDSGAPVSRGGLAPGAQRVLLRAICRSAAGRARVKLVVELKPLGVPFDGEGLLVSRVWHDSGREGVTLELLSPELAPGTRYRWRAATLQHPSDWPGAPRSPWVAFDRLGGGVEGDFRARAEDGQACVWGQQCASGFCVDGSCCAFDCGGPCHAGCGVDGCVPLDCDDGDPCSGQESCDPETGCVAGEPLVCDDDDACNGQERCEVGVGCVAGSALVCDDDDVCNGVESCDPATGCTAGTPLVCDDGDACNGAETCDPVRGCMAWAAPICDDGDPCNGVEGCDPATGCTAGTPLVCDDGDACNGLETCAVGVGCVAGEALVCDDGDPCDGVETCDPATGCVAGAAPVCDDGDACNGAEACEAGVGCVAGTALVCDDGDACNGVETCDATNGCVPGVGLVCDDGDVCNGTETCHADTGCVAGEALVCDDGSLCNGTETCDPLAGCQPGAPLVCDDGDVCNGAEVCHSERGCLAGTALDCDDGVPCTADSCDPSDGCRHDPTGCPCVGDPDCDDGDVCNGAETCDLATGCRTGEALVCDDGDACNGVESCDPTGGCESGEPPDCDDDDPCSIDGCDPAQGCVYEPAPGPCDDGDPCTADDQCGPGGCAGVPYVCELLPCRESVDCDGAGGCDETLVESGTPCDDDDICTRDDACQRDGTCAGEAVDCDDRNPCTDDLCVPAVGCVGVPNEAGCTDGDPCTTESCRAGDCVVRGEVPDCCRSDGDCPEIGQRCIDNECVDVYCTPCETAADCGTPDDHCFELAEGQRCGRACEEDVDCPDGAICERVSPGSKQCLPADGRCDGDPVAEPAPDVAESVDVAEPVPDVAPDVPPDISTDVPGDVPADIDIDVSSDVPVDVPVDVPADVPVDALADVPVDAEGDVRVDPPDGTPPADTPLADTPLVDTPPRVDTPRDPEVHIQLPELYQPDTPPEADVDPNTPLSGTATGGGGCQSGPTGAAAPVALLLLALFASLRRANRAADASVRARVAPRRSRDRQRRM